MKKKKKMFNHLPQNMWLANEFSVDYFDYSPTKGLILYSQLPFRSESRYNMKVHV